MTEKDIKVKLIEAVTHSDLPKLEKMLSNLPFSLSIDQLHALLSIVTAVSEIIDNLPKHISLEPGDNSLLFEMRKRTDDMLSYFDKKFGKADVDLYTYASMCAPYNYDHPIERLLPGSENLYLENGCSLKSIDLYKAVFALDFDKVKALLEDGADNMEILFMPDETPEFGHQCIPDLRKEIESESENLLHSEWAEGVGRNILVTAIDRRLLYRLALLLEMKALLEKYCSSEGEVSRPYSWDYYNYNSGIHREWSAQEITIAEVRHYAEEHGVDIRLMDSESIELAKREVACLKSGHLILDGIFFYRSVEWMRLSSDLNLHPVEDNYL